MNVKKFKIPIYDYDVMYVEVEKGDKIKELKPHLKYIEGTEYMKEVLEDVTNGKFNGGQHFYNPRFRRVLLFLYRQTSKKSRLNILGHEKRHLEDRLLEATGINDIEAAGYLAGFLTKQLF